MITLLLIGVLALLFVTAALAPLESLSWFSSSGAKQPGRLQTARSTHSRKRPRAKAYVVYLSGIGAISGTSIPVEEYPFLHQLEQSLPGVRVITDIYPYSVTNNGLTGQRQFAQLWRRIEKMRLKNPNSALSLIVNIRNLFQMFVSADRRYGPIYNLGTSQEIVRGLIRHGYETAQPRPLFLIGWSGGGQIAIGAANYLGQLGGKLYVISLGGMLSDDTGLDHIKHLWHLYGTKDKLQAMGKILYAGRWGVFPQSPWNRALRRRAITLQQLGPYHHNGTGNYFDMETTLPDSSQSYGAHTLDTIVQIVRSVVQ